MGDHFSEERVKFGTCKVMVVMRMRIRHHRSERQARHKTQKVSAVPLWQRSGPRLTSLIDSTFLSMKMTAWRLIPSGPGYRYLQLDSWSWHVYSRLLKLIYSVGDQHYWTIAIILAICDTFTVVVYSFSGLAILVATNPMCACMPDSACF